MSWITDQTKDKTIDRKRAEAKEMLSKGWITQEGYDMMMKEYDRIEGKTNDKV